MLGQFVPDPAWRRFLIAIRRVTFQHRAPVMLKVDVFLSWAPGHKTFHSNNYFVQLNTIQSSTAGTQGVVVITFYALWRPAHRNSAVSQETIKSTTDCPLWETRISISANKKIKISINERVIIGFDHALPCLVKHYNDVIMSVIASQITSLVIVYSTVYSAVDQRKHQSSASQAFVRGIHRGPVNSPHKWPVTRKMFLFDDVIMKPWRTVLSQEQKPMPRPRFLSTESLGPPFNDTPCETMIMAYNKD